ncbi:hypothetical protein H5P28_08245 [Ruficoccus amylovorans]|uniref:Uncharacterized protein n=1 Tax=Ruficoccus amylovorans TaxID=1804625 RepID=A0A842HG72_9BACT|nr:hypothetical protein [Ruficoccus amylovorans]MBC2594251.1 hypothetical protein [Ruficoccus amylovorans]
MLAHLYPPGNAECKKVARGGAAGEMIARLCYFDFLLLKHELGRLSVITLHWNGNMAERCRAEPGF